MLIYGSSVWRWVGIGAELNAVSGSFLLPPAPLISCRGGGSLVLFSFCFSLNDFSSLDNYNPTAPMRAGYYAQVWAGATHQRIISHWRNGVGTQCGKQFVYSQPRPPHYAQGRGFARFKWGLIWI